MNARTYVRTNGSSCTDLEPFLESIPEFVNLILFSYPVNICVLDKGGEEKRAVRRGGR